MNRFYEKGWFRFVIHFAISAILICILLIILYNENLMSDMGCSLGIVTIILQTLLFISFDLLGDFDNMFICILRGFLIVIGFLGIGAFGAMFSGWMGSEKSLLEDGVGLVALYTMWFTYGILTYISYWLITNLELNEFLFPFVSIPAFIIAYLIHLCYALMAQAWSSFFIGYFGLIICLIAFVVVVVLSFKIGIEFGSVTETSELFKNFKSYKPPKTKVNTNTTKKPNGNNVNNSVKSEDKVKDNKNENEKSDKNLAHSYSLNNDLEYIIKDKIDSKYNWLREDKYYYGKITNFKNGVDVNAMFNKLRISVDFDCEYTLHSAFDDVLKIESDYVLKCKIEEEIKDAKSKMKSIIEKTINDGISEFEKKYDNLDDMSRSEPDIKINCDNPFDF